MPKVKRSYVSGHRRDLAQRTREKILASARELFRDRGYGATTIQDIAEHASVAVPTVYAVFGGKRAILLRLLDSIEGLADQSSLVASLAEHVREPRAQLRAFVDFHIRLFTLGADMIRIAQLAGEANQDIAELWALGAARRLETCQKLVASFAPHRALKAGLSQDRAVDILWALSGPETYSLFVRDRRWSPETLGDWLFAIAQSELLAPSPRTAPETPIRQPSRRQKD
jgi:AcrR family transcriptional regulator